MGQKESGINSGVNKMCLKVEFESLHENIWYIFLNEPAYITSKFLRIEHQGLST